MSALSEKACFDQRRRSLVYPNLSSFNAGYASATGTFSEIFKLTSEKDPVKLFCLKGKSVFGI